MRNIHFLLATIATLFVLTSCSPKISVKASKDGGSEVSFKTGFSELAAKTLRSISGLPENAPIFSEDDIKDILTQAGIQKARVRVPSSMQIESSGFISKIPTEIAKANIFKQTSNSLSITLGPNQIREVYTRLGDESQAYFDMMMIPTLIGEEMSVSEYRTLLGSMYGPTFANELVDGKLSINLSSPDGKKSKTAETSLGEILTLTEEKTWTLEW